eukprot:CAMPEP_0185017648 /NCGR_PEP_ID=MMETSP1103-20130426/570_1 /TAXON_ID=36769 /ORGANISM="Paraphysomonas bandaiensis, Strain Caron Lab Isolate" /LENGTH=411 /DNA_ID=CAMNT_0027547153 /DNA_START=214 /DNA_END=1449 /DNA_ORIENTATION=+
MIPPIPSDHSPTEVSAPCSDDGVDGDQQYITSSRYVTPLSVGAYESEGGRIGAYESEGGRLRGYSEPSSSSFSHHELSSAHSSQAGSVVEVRFKCTKDSYKITDRCPDVIRVGSAVVVEADRGFDAGVVHAIHPPAPVSLYAPSQTSSLRSIISLASPEDKQLMQDNSREEERALQLCRHLAQVRHVPITVAAAEMQFDRKKLTIIFSADRRVDFRELVRDMFQVFKTRIWMQKVSPAEAAALAFMFPTAPLAPDAVPQRVHCAPRSTRQVYTPQTLPTADGQGTNSVPFTPSTSLPSEAGGSYIPSAKGGGFGASRRSPTFSSGPSLYLSSISELQGQTQTLSTRQQQPTTPGGSASSLRVDSAVFYPTYTLPQPPSRQVPANTPNVMDSSTYHNHNQEHRDHLYAAYQF